ncbi:choice-of-anchor D domain-containing protein [Vulgatibacter sp.]|uniref:choice-of-anchor D domain-containing protein n=1 Tax=Vulgatibacter sp. TaxID=1971226 RepID=UPI0035686FEE
MQFPRALLPLILALAACSGGEPLTAGSVTIEPALEPDPTGSADFLLAFEPVAAGKQASRTLTFRNRGGMPVAFEAPPLAAPFSAAPAAPGEIPPQASRTMEIHFAPQRAGAYEAIAPLTLGAETRWLRVAGRGLAPPDGACTLVPEATGLSFGTTGVAALHVRRLAIRNESAYACSAALAIEGDGSFRTEQQIELQPGESIAVPVVLEPRAVGSLRSTLHLRGDTARTVALSAEVVERCIEAPASIPFGTVDEGCWSSEFLPHLRSRCDHPVQLVAVGLESLDFRVTSRPVLPFRIEPRGQLRIGLQHTPRHAIRTEAALSLAEDAGSPQTIRLEGAGAPRAPERWAERQGLLPAADRLYLVDDGAGMALHHERLAAHAAALTGAIATTDLRAGVTTTSRSATAGCATSGADGRLLPVDGSAERMLDRQLLQAGALAPRLQVAACSTAANEAFAAAERAVGFLTGVEDDPAHPEPDDGNLALRREEVPLQIVFVADRDDASTGAIETWVARFTALQQERNLAFTALLAGPDCAEVPRSHRIATLVRALGGSVHPLCGEPLAGQLVTKQPDWPFATRFHLPSTPFDRDADGAVDEAGDGFALFVEGEHVPQLDGDRLRYTVRPETAVVEFEPELAPPPDATFEFVYLPECR